MIPVVYIFITSLFQITGEHHGYDNMIIRCIKYFLREKFCSERFTPIYLAPVHQTGVGGERDVEEQIYP
jgi:hypothetical protein